MIRKGTGDKCDRSNEVTQKYAEACQRVSGIYDYFAKTFVPASQWPHQDIITVNLVGIRINFYV